MPKTDGGTETAFAAGGTLARYVAPGHSPNALRRPFLVMEKPAVPRSQDAAYTNALKQVQVKRKAIASRRREVAEQMAALVARARKALPEGATEEQIRNELLNNPRKYPGWRELSRMLRERNAKADKDLEDARRLVAARIRQEQAEFSKRGGTK